MYTEILILWRRRKWCVIVTEIISMFKKMNCSKEEMYFLIESLRRANISVTEIHRITSEAWPDQSYSVRHIRKLCKEFNDERRVSFERKEGSGSGKSDLRVQNLEAIETLIKDNNRISIRRIAEQLNLSHSMVQRIITEDTERIWCQCKWVPHTLTEVNKATRVERCQDLLDSLGSRLAQKNLVTIDEKMFYSRNMIPTNVTGCWLSATGDDSTLQVARRSTMEKKFHVIVAVSQQGHHFFRILPKNETLNSERYIDFLIGLEAFLTGLPTPILPQNLRIIQDNARPHVARNTRTHMEDHNIRTLRQPPYSPDCNLCDRYVFPRLESRRKGNFETIQELQHFLELELPHFTQERMSKALLNLTEDLQKIIDAGGEYL